jgi:peptidoglycan hydrolase CwlO-like protein
MAARTKKDLEAEIVKLREDVSSYSQRLTDAGSKIAALVEEVDKLQDEVAELERAEEKRIKNESDDPAEVAAAMVRATTSGHISWLSHEERQQWLERAEAAIACVRGTAS